MILAFGILCGLLCAFSHSLCYLFTRRFLIAPGRSSLQLISIGHLMMGGFSLVALPFFWRTPEAGWWGAFAPLCGAAGFYIVAQFLFFKLVTWSPASRVSPLLGIKILFLASLAYLVNNTHLSVTQWVAVGLCLLAALLLARGGGDKLPVKVMVGAAFTTLFYALSDLYIARTLHAISAAPSVGASIFALCLTYLFCAFFALIWLIHPHYNRTSRDRGAWRDGIAFSLSWYAAMVFLYSAISFLGVVPAIILQSTRGPMSVGLGLLVAALGHQMIEQKILRADAMKYLFAALLMCASLALYFA